VIIAEMRHTWEFNDEDIRLVTQLIERMSGCGLMVVRQKRNLAPERASVTREKFWLHLVASLLTSQQRSGPTSPISRFLEISPFPLQFDICESSKDTLATYANAILVKHGGIRFHERIPKFLVENLRLVCGDAWQELSVQLDRLRSHSSIVDERVVANFIEDRFSGIGPKQARNLLQMLGLTRFVIPIDSRVLSWMNDNGFPVPSSAGLLAFRDYFEFVENGLNELCDRCGIAPCIFDAAVFGQSDGEGGSGWTEQNAMW
jgi:thermostable 8-oxoguanine DNA glycosylase